MWIKVIQWVSIALCWGSLGLNIWSFMRSNRMFKKYCTLYLELLREREHRLAEDCLTNPKE